MQMPDETALRPGEAQILGRARDGKGYNRRPVFALRRALVARLGAAEGHRLWRALIPADMLPPGEALRPLRLTPMQQAAHDTGGLIPIAPQGRIIEAPPPRVIGEGNHRILRKAGRAAFAGRLQGAVVVGASAAILAGERLVWDGTEEEIEETGDAIDFDPAIVAHDPATGRLLAPDYGPDLPGIDTGFDMLGWTSGNFGHWMMEYLPRFMLAQIHGGLPDRAVVLVDEVMPPSHYEALSLLLPEGAELRVVPRFTPLRVRDLGVVSALNYPALAPQRDDVVIDHAAVDPELFSTAARAMAARLDETAGPGDGPEKVYLSRRAFARRALVNIDEIEEAARAEGFAIVQPETLSFAEQFRLLRGARVVAGPEGSAMMLGMFCRPGTRAVLLNHQVTEHLPTLSAALERGGLDITVLTGPEEDAQGKFAHNASYRVDPEMWRGLLAGG